MKGLDMDISFACMYLAYFCCAMLLFFIVNRMGSKMASSGYKDMFSEMSQTERSFNTVFRIIAPVLIWCLIASGVKLLGVNISLESFSVIVFYWLIRLASLIVFKKIRPGYLRGFFGRAIASCLLSLYFTYNIICVDVNLLIPETSDVVFQFWIVFALAAVALLSDVRPGQEFNYEKQYFIISRLAGPLFPKRFQDDVILRALFFSFAMIEDYYRPLPIRWVERLVHRFRLAKTTGIMQVKSDRALSDAESILASFPIIEKIWGEYLERSTSISNLDGFSCSETNYTYSFGELERQVKEDFDAIHANYMGTIHFRGSEYFLEAVYYLKKYNYISDDTKVTVRKTES